MAFFIPEMPLPCDVYDGPWVTRVFREQIFGNLALGKRVAPNFGSYGNSSESPASVLTMLLIPALTDVRSRMQVADPDVLEIPSGSGRWYKAESVDDIGKGFPNEHRYVLLAQLSEAIDPVKAAGLFWPVPMP